MAWRVIVDFCEGNDSYGICKIVTNDEGTAKLIVDVLEADIVDNQSSSSSDG